jgi:hypothetical protein
MIAMERTLYPRIRCMNSGKRVSSSMSLMTKGCCVCQTQPEGVSSMGTSPPLPVCFSPGMRDSRMCKRITLRGAS